STFPPDIAYVDRFLSIQAEARTAGRGLWGLEPINLDLVIIAVDKRREYVDIENTGSEPVALNGWTLVSERGGQRCELGGDIGPGATVRVWALAEDAGQGGYNCGFTNPIWSNDEPDPAVLYDRVGAEVSRKE
ncbi:MAG: lamin tail domain-containing protein, partial [Anaerolineae bacterium]|nr:lamin tail domain-containing protein [Anaerolineae bacterium]